MIARLAPSASSLRHSLDSGSHRLCDRPLDRCHSKIVVHMPPTHPVDALVVDVLLMLSCTTFGNSNNRGGPKYT